MPDIETALSLVRHPGRPNAKEYIERLFPDFLPLGGDRLHGEDPAVLGWAGDAGWPARLRLSTDPRTKFGRKSVLWILHAPGRRDTAKRCD